MNDIALVATELPAHAKKGSGLGNENITQDHLQTPRVKQLQQLSNEVDENHSEYIEGAKPGDFVNTVTNKLLGRELYIINLLFKEEFVDDLERTQQDTFLVHGTKYYLKLVEEKVYTYSDEHEVKKIELDRLKKELKALKEHEEDCGIAKYEGSKLSLRPTINTQAI